MIQTIDQAIDAILSTYSGEDLISIRDNYEESVMFIVGDILDKIDSLGMRTGNTKLLEACRTLTLPEGVVTSEEEDENKEEVCLLYAVLECMKTGG